MNLFGTDGIRGLSNVWPITAEVAMKVGMSVVLCLGDRTLSSNIVIIGKDTRLSSYMLETSLTSGLVSMGKSVMLVGPMSTPAVALLTKSMRADLGIMISASHNPYHDNGIKIFNHDGYKISHEDEKKISDLAQQDLSQLLVKPDHMGSVSRLKEAVGRYIYHVKSFVSRSFTLFKLKIVVDCANGALYKIAPIVLSELGARVIPIGVNPNGKNINLHCGATDTNLLTAKVLEVGADLGIAFDGDGDRIIIVDEKGVKIDGDHILGVIATEWQRIGKLKHSKVVVTHMTNTGLTDYLENLGIQSLRSDVGDRNVLSIMVDNELNLGGEQSGHIILRDSASTGDGLLAALEILNILVASKKTANQLFNIYEEVPQIMLNCTYDKTKIEDGKNLEKIVEGYKEKYEQVRILVRKSGTESVLRIMVEGRDHTLVKEVAKLLVKDLEIYS